MLQVTPARIPDIDKHKRPVTIVSARIYEAQYGDDEATYSLSDCPLVAAALALRKAWSSELVPFGVIGGRNDD